MAELGRGMGSLALFAAALLTAAAPAAQTADAEYEADRAVAVAQVDRILRGDDTGAPTYELFQPERTDPLALHRVRAILASCRPESDFPVVRILEEEDSDPAAASDRAIAILWRCPPHNPLGPEVTNYFTIRAGRVISAQLSSGYPRRLRLQESDR
jgi:hypothetical protein